MNQIEMKFLAMGKAVIQPGGWILLSKTNAIEFVSECELESIPILGIDGFYVFENSIQPSLENSVDFTSSINSTTNIYQFSKQFILNKADNLFFEVVCKK